MKIQVRGYILEASENAAGRFDLKKLSTRTRTLKDGEKESYESEDYLGYAMRLETCLTNIINLDINKKFEAETITLKQYIDEFKREKSSLIEEISSKTEVKLK